MGVPHAEPKSNQLFWKNVGLRGGIASVTKPDKEVLLQPGDTPEMIVPYEKGALIYAYCNKHGLWKTEVK